VAFAQVGEIGSWGEFLSQALPTMLQTAGDVYGSIAQTKIAKMHTKGELELARIQAEAETRKAQTLLEIEKLKSQRASLVGEAMGEVPSWILPVVIGGIGVIALMKLKRR